MSKNMWFGLIMIVGGIALGIYVGFIYCFIGGVVAIINEIKSPEAVSVAVVAWSVAKIFFAAIAGWISAFSLIIPGVSMFK